MFKVNDKVWFRNPELFASSISSAKGFGWNCGYCVVEKINEDANIITILFSRAGVRAEVPPERLIRVYDVVKSDLPDTGESVKPEYYQIIIKGNKVDVFDIARAMNLPFTLSSALKYFRVKGDKDKQINDLQKAIECIKREIEYLKSE